MKLIIFDVDGTLTDTNQVDKLCFEETLQELIGFKGKDWAEFDYLLVTDPGYVITCYKDKLERSPSEKDIAAIKELFHANLESESQEMKGFSPIPGAAEMLNTLKALPNVGIALATGCWQFSAELKMEMSGVDFHDIPFANADHFSRRDEIMLHAIELAKKHYGVEEFNSIVYVGDGLWDLKTCAKLSIPFLGVDVLNSGKLKEAGAKHVVQNYLDTEIVLSALELAAAQAR